MTGEPLPISVVVLTYNEELNLGKCLRSVTSWAAETIVVDSGSTDGTREIAEAYGATILSHPFTDHRSQWSWALHEVPLRSQWVLGLDADQEVMPALADELRNLFTSNTSTLQTAAGFFVKRRQIFRGRWLRHGGYYPKYLLKLFRREAVYFDPRDMLDHHFYVDGPTHKLTSDIIEHNRNEDNITFWISKHNSYAVRHAREEFLRRTGPPEWALRPTFFGNPDQRVIWLKERWYRLPLFVRPVLYFLYRYLLRRGFLDRKEGFIFHFLHAFWYRLLVDIHLEDMLLEHRGTNGTFDQSAQGSQKVP